MRERFGVEDRWPVVCEPFTQWVLEDAFSLGRPPYEDAGVQVVEDVEPYELMKLRLLNAEPPGARATSAYLVRIPARPRGGAGPALPRRSCAATWTRRRRRRSRRCPGVDLDEYKRDADRALLQPRGARHDRAAVRRELGPHPEVAAAGRARASSRPAARSRARRRSSRAGRATPRASTSRASRSRSSTGCAERLDGDRAAPARGPRRLHRQPRAVRRPRRRRRGSSRPTGPH